MYADARSVGVTRRQLRGAAYRRLGSGVYRWAGLNETPQLMLAAVARRLPPGAAFSGRTAAWLHGLDLPPCDPIEVTMPEPLGSSRRAGASVCRGALAKEEIVLRRRLPTCSFMPGSCQWQICAITLQTIRERKALRGSGALWTWPSWTPNPQWRAGYECCS